MKSALKIGKNLKNVDCKLLKLAIIFHDIDYHSEETYKENYNCHVNNSIKVAEKFLKENNFCL